MTYQGNRQAAATLIDAVRAMPVTADLIAQADALLLTASNQAVAQDIAAAEASVVEARRRAEDAKTASEAQATLEGMRDDAALDNVASDFAAALAVFNNMRAEVVRQDSSSTFTTAIEAADGPVADAQTEVDGGSPDMTLVRSKLDEGIAMLEAVLPQIIAHGLYQTHYTAALAQVQALDPLNTANNNCIQTAIDACNALLGEAQNVAQDPSFNFVAAEDKVGQATERARQAQANVTAYSATIAPGQQAMTNPLATINAAPAAVVTYMNASVTRLNDLQSDITVALAAEDFDLAEAKATEGTALAGTTAQDVTICTTINTNYTNWVTNKIAQIQTGQPEVASYLADANRLINEFNSSVAAGSYRIAEGNVNSIGLAIDAGIRAIQEAANYNTAKTATRGRLDTLVGMRTTGIEEHLSALEDRYAEAEALATADTPQFIIATAKMAEIEIDADALSSTAQEYSDYETAKSSAEAKLLEAEGHDQISAIETTVQMLRTKYTTAEQLAQDGNPARAQTILAEVQSGAEDAIGNADNVEIFAGVSEAIGSSASDTAGPTFVHIEAARQAHNWQASKENASIASDQLAEAETKIDLAANDATPPADQTIALESAMALITEAGEIISQHTLMVQALANARSRVAALRAHAQSAYLDTQLTEMEAAIDGIEADATDLASLQASSARLETVLVNEAEYATKLDARQEYLDIRSSAECEPRLAMLEAHDHAYAVQTDIANMRGELSEAAHLNDTFDPVAAVACLNEAKTIGHNALVLAEMRDNNVPSVADLQTILDGPGGQEQLDAMVDQLEPDAQFAVMEAAFEARFGCDLQQAGIPPDTNIRRFYEIMSDLPDSATLDNDSLRTFIDSTGAGTSAYTPGNVKQVAMRESDAVLSTSYNFGAEYQVGDVEEGCEPADEEPVNFFSWNTLHEVGHAVDDQQGFMNNRQSGADYGGWTVFGQNTTPIADALASHFNYDKTYIQQTMGERLAGGGNPRDANSAAPVPDGCSPEEWEGRRVNFVSWLRRVRAGSQPWSTQSIAEQIAIGSLVYQEAYGGTWVSYQLASRRRGMTAYQFRAPAEWFSELYAAFHSGKIKDNHTSASWLGEMAGPDA